MATFQWIPDVPAGVFRNHSLSSKLRETALEETKFVGFTRPEPGYGKGRGDTHTITRIAAITEPTDIELLETDTVPEDAFSISTVSFTVKEIGRSVPYTNLADQLTTFDLSSQIQKELRRQLALCLDTRAATAYRDAKVKYIPTGLSSGTFDTDGTASTTALENMNVFHAEEIYDYLYDTLRAPPQDGDDYIGIFRQLGIRGMLRDPDWEQWHVYTNPEAKYNGEAGRLENIRFITSNHANALRKQGSGSILGEGFVFGDDNVAIIEAMKPELLAGIPSDLGRKKLVGWYGILKFGLVWDTANAGQARVVHVTSA